MKRCFSCFHTYDDDFGVCPFCGQVENNKPVEPIHLAPGTILADRYILGHALGSGGFGIVYKAWDSKLEIIVAVKEFFVSRLVTRAEGLKNLIITKKSQEEFEYRKKRFLAEARNMAKFGAHRSIPNVFEFFEENNTAYIVMELLKGVALNDYLHQCGGKLDIDFALMVANEVGTALKSLHEQNIIHRDVAPDNIFICSGKEIKVKLMDLGAAKLADSTDDVVDIILKPGYSPTEQYDNSNNIGPWTDIYALGATLYVMLTGIKPDESTNRKINAEVVPPNEINPSISVNLSNAVMKAMALEQHMRFRNVNEFLDAINGGRKVISLAAERKRRNLKRIFGIAASCLVLCVGIIFGFQIFSNKQSEQYLKPADISLWFSVEEGSTEEAAMQSIKADFESTFEGVTVELKAIPEDEYQETIENAAQNDSLPTLFESTGVSQSVLDKALDLDNVLSSDQFKSALFLNQYEKYYRSHKQLPLAIEVPIAFLVTKGAESIDYSDRHFNSLDELDYSKISIDEMHSELIHKNYPKIGTDYTRTAFLNNENNTSAVMLSSTMVINEVRTTLTNYEKAYVYPNSESIQCNFIYEWSMCGKDKNEIAAGERLLSWMLGNVYQSYMMVSKCNDGQIPVNQICFETKIESQYLSPIKEVYDKFVFERS